MKKVFSLTCAFLCAALSFSLQARDLTPANYIEAFSSGSIIEKQKTIESLAWAGLSDPKIFDLIEKDLLDNYATADDGNMVRALNWAARGLAFSGNEKYNATLAKVAEGAKHKKLRKHAQNSLAELREYSVWNPLINPSNASGSDYPNDAERYKIMLQSGNFEVIRLAAKRIHHEGVYSQDVLDVTMATIEKYYQNVDDDDTALDAMAWTAKALAGSKDLKYKPFIESIATNANNKKMRKYATKYLNYYRS